MSNNKHAAYRYSMLKLARRRKQSGELSMIEAGAVMAGAVLLALAVYAGAKSVYDNINASRFKSEAQNFHTGILNATQNDADFSGATLTTLAKNHAFDAAGSRLATDYSAIKGLFSGAVTTTVGTLATANDSLVLNYPVTPTVCSMSVAALATVFSMVQVGSTTISSPTSPFTSAAAATACAPGTATVTLALYTSRN
jgi:PilS N terminal